MLLEGLDSKGEIFRALSQPALDEGRGRRSSDTWRPTLQNNETQSTESLDTRPPAPFSKPRLSKGHRDVEITFEYYTLVQCAPWSFGSRLSES